MFRLKNFPYSEDSELVKWFLWSRNKEGCPQGIFSHYTALRIYEISDAMPSRVHMIVPKAFRKQATIPKDLVLHKEEVFSEEIHEMKGFKVTKPLRTFYDLIHSGLEAKDSALLYQAIRQALQEGFMTRTTLKKSKLWAMVKENNWSFS